MFDLLFILLTTQWDDIKNVIPLSATVLHLSAVLQFIRNCKNFQIKLVQFYQTSVRKFCFFVFGNVVLCVFSDNPNCDLN
jgi:hypothetical protein